MFQWSYPRALNLGYPSLCMFYFIKSKTHSDLIFQSPLTDLEHIGALDTHKTTAKQSRSIWCATPFLFFPNIKPLESSWCPSWYTKRTRSRNRQLVWTCSRRRQSWISGPRFPYFPAWSMCVFHLSLPITYSFSCLAVKQVFPSLEFIGWYTITPKPTARHIALHEQVRRNHGPLSINF